MILSELIEKLIEFREKFGDIKIQVCASENESTLICNELYEAAVTIGDEVCMILLNGYITHS